ncbi:MAG: hypothetical protein JXD22_14470, partial [Sedimentisphaerales bacterium]|nr:hypothetical protein [Sedimentisphaerales bacterium]
SLGFCQEADEASEQLQAAESQLELHRIQLEIQKSEAEADFRQQMRELELEERRIELDRQREELKFSGHQKHPNKNGAVPFILLCLVVHILVTVWVYQDVRKRNACSGIWIAIALLAGLLGVLVYAVVRIGDNQQSAPKAAGK